MSCYIPAFTEINGRKQRSACGRWIRQDEHSAEPTCPDCKRWLEADAAEAAQFETVEDQTEALFGSSADAPPVTLNTFSSVDGYRPKGASQTAMSARNRRVDAVGGPVGDNGVTASNGVIPCPTPDQKAAGR